MQVIQLRSRAASQSAQQAPSVSGPTIIALALALLTGLALGQMTQLGSEPFQQAPTGSTEASRTGLLFYDAIDAYFTTGQAGELQSLIQPDFVDHIDGQPEAKGIEPFLKTLDGFRAAVGGEGLTVTPMPSSGNLVRFSVEMPKADAVVLGLPIVQTKAHTYSETLRVDDGRVAERWSALQLPVVMTPLASVAWNPPPGSQMLPAIDRITMLGGSSMTLRFGAAHVIAVELGSLAIEGTPHRAVASVPEFPPDSTELADAETFVALPGSTVFAGGNGPYRIVNEGPAVARALLIRIAGQALSSDPPAFETFGTSYNDTGVQIERLSASLSLPNHTGDWTIEIGRATLTPGTTVPAHVVAGAELISVEEGTLEANLVACDQRCIQTTEGAGMVAGDLKSVQAGQGVSASNGASPEYRVAGSAPVTLLIVTVTPAGA